MSNSIHTAINLIKKGKKEEALKVYEEIKTTIDKKNGVGYKYIKNYFFELDYYDWVMSDNDSNINIYFKEGLKLIENNSYEEAVNFFLKAKDQEYDSFFSYYIGLCYYNLGDYKSALHYFKDYMKDTGALNLLECCEFMIKIYNILIRDSEDEQEINNLKKKKELTQSKINMIKNVMNGNISTHTEVKHIVQINFYEETDIIELIKIGKINDVVAAYEESDYIRKINILALLYRNNSERLADKLLKKDRNSLKENCKDHLDSLNKNKALYLAQAKYKGN